MSHAPRPLDAPTVSVLQRSAGNAAVVSLLASAAAQGRVPERSGRAVQRDEKEGLTSIGPRGSGLTLRPSGESLIPPFPLRPPVLSVGAGASPDWTLFSELFRNRGLTLGEGDAAVVGAHWRRWFPLAGALHGLPLVGRFKSREDIINALTGSMIDASLARDHPNAFERFNLEGEKFGASTKMLWLKEFKW